MKKRNAGLRLMSLALSAMLMSQSLVNIHAEEEQPTEETTKITDETLLREDGMVRVSIVLKDNSLIEQGYDAAAVTAKNNSALSYRSKLESSQHKLEEKVSSQILQGKPLDVVWNLTLAGNMISAWVPAGNIAEIADLAEVKDVIVENRYEASDPIGNEAEPQMAVSSYMTDSLAVWGNGVDGYTGAGTQVAIIDTGLDTDHQSFSVEAFMYALRQLSDAGRDVELLKESDISEVWSQLNASKNSSYSYSDVYRDAKVPFGYNYIDQSLEITHDHDSQGEHGSHVAGIAAANRYIPDGDGFTEALQSVYTQGQAPDAQIVVMKVFGEKGGAYDSDYIAAMEDALLLGCESINLSLGQSRPGFSYYHSDKGYYTFFQSLQQSQAVVSISAGNMGQWADHASTQGRLYSDDVSFDTVSYPGSADEALTVASVDNDGVVGNYITVNNHQIYYTDAEGVAKMTSLASQKAYEYVYVEGYDPTKNQNALSQIAKDKVVVISREESDLFDKLDGIASTGARAIIIANNTIGTVTFDMTGFTGQLAVCSITQTDGLYLKKQGKASKNNGITCYTGNMLINDQAAVSYLDSNAYTMSSFSSWGMPGSLHLKPEISAPGGNIYSVNGAEASGKAYENMSGTSMAAPQIAGISAVLAQSLKENHMDEWAKEHGMTLRTMENSLLMSTAVPVVQSEAGSYYPVFRQGAGLVNVREAVNAGVMILMDETATSSAADGKVKAELGDDPDRTGLYRVKFKVYNLVDEPQPLTLGSALFTQNCSTADGISYMNGSTITIPSNVIWYRNGEALTTMDQLNQTYDFNGDGIYDEQDSQAVLAYAVGKTDALQSNAEHADMDQDGDIDTYDAYLVLHEKESTQAVVPASSMIELEAVIQIDMPQHLDDNGNYVEGYLFVEEESDQQGVKGTSHSIPLVGYYGSWMEPSMFDRGNADAYAYGTETRTPYTQSKVESTNVIKIMDNTGNLNYEYRNLGSNPIVADVSYHPERAAINTRDRLRRVEYTLIRNAAAERFDIVDESGKTILKKIYDAEGSAYYNGQSGWMDTSSSKTFDVKMSGRNIKEGTKLTYTFTAVPEYYKQPYGEVNWDAAGDSAKIQVTAVLDNTAPKITSTELIKDHNGKTTGLRVQASEENYIAAVILYKGNTYTNPIQTIGASEDAQPGTTNTYTFTDLPESDSYTVQVYDYAANTKRLIVKADTGESVEDVIMEEADDETEDSNEEMIEAETGTLQNVANYNLSSFIHSDTNPFEVNKEGNTIAVSLKTSEELNTNGKYEITLNEQDFEHIEVMHQLPYVDEFSQNGIMTIGFINENALAKDYETAVLKLTLKEYVSGTIEVNETEVNASHVSNHLGSYTYQDGSFKDDQPGTDDIQFEDVPESEYYYEPVKWAVSKGITSGTSKTTFSPEAECTRAQVATFLWRATGQPEPKSTTNPFTDVSNSGQMKPFYKAILWAYEQGITSGTSKTLFSPNAACTRAQIVTFLYRYAGKPAVSNISDPFTDIDNIGSMRPFYEPIMWAVQNGITTGTSKTKFSPDQTCTRGQAVTFLYRLLTK